MLQMAVTVCQVFLPGCKFYVFSPGSSVNPFQSVIWCQSPRLCTHPLFCMSHMWNSTVVIHYWKNHCWFQMITRKLTHPIFCMSHMRLWLLLCIRIFLIWNTTVVIHYLKKYKHCWFQVCNTKINEISQIWLSLMWPLITT